MLSLGLHWSLFSHLYVAITWHLWASTSSFVMWNVGVQWGPQGMIWKDTLIYGVIEMHGLFSVISGFGAFHPWGIGLQAIKEGLPPDLHPH